MRARPGSSVLIFLTLAAIAAACQSADRGADRTAADTAAIPTNQQASSPAAPDCVAPRPPQQPGTRTVAVYFACDGPIPGQLYPVYRRVPESVDPIHAALEQMLRGPTEDERARGFRSRFSEATAGMLLNIDRSAGGDTVTIDFADFRSAVGERPGATSFLAGGVMADITWTVFQHFPEVQALRFAFDGSERAFASWLAGAPAESQVFTREDWEMV